MKGRLHLLERLDHVFPLNDGSGLWASGYWELSEEERLKTKSLFLHREKAKRSHFGGDVIEIRPAADFAEKALQHDSPTEGRWVLIVRATKEGKGVAWEGESHVRVYKSLT